MNHAVHHVVYLTISNYLLHLLSLSVAQLLGQFALQTLAQGLDRLNFRLYSLDIIGIGGKGSKELLCSRAKMDRSAPSFLRFDPFFYGVLADQISDIRVLQSGRLILKCHLLSSSIFVTDFVQLGTETDPAKALLRLKKLSLIRILEQVEIVFPAIAGIVRVDAVHTLPLPTIRGTTISLTTARLPTVLLLAREDAVTGVEVAALHVTGDLAAVNVASVYLATADVP
jgi:hypothetical protein